MPNDRVPPPGLPPQPTPVVGNIAVAPAHARDLALRDAARAFEAVCDKALPVLEGLAHPPQEIKPRGVHLTIKATSDGARRERLLTSRLLRFDSDRLTWRLGSEMGELAPDESLEISMEWIPAQP